MKESQDVTAALAARIVSLRIDDVTAAAGTVAKQCLMDWLGVAIAGRNEPLVDILIRVCMEEDGRSDCSIIGGGPKVALSQAALVNGAISHALDFDDVIMGMGHPSVPVAPVVMALGEKMGASGEDALLAFIAGVETECRIAAFIGPSHYAKGFHATATFGTFGAMAAAAKLLRLDIEQTRHAFGIAGTQAAGLKSMFGTMTKPLHAGKAAQNGLLAARLAAKGFTADREVLTGAQGFADTQSSGADESRALADPDGGFHIVDTLFKYHAACYLTHSAIEAANEIRRTQRIDPAAIDSVRVHVDSRHLGVCNIEKPVTGLECKFSLRMTAAMALSGEDTFDDRLFNDKTAARADLVALRDKVRVVPDSVANIGIVEVRMKDGRAFSATADTGVPARDLSAQQEKLERKFLHLVRPALGQDRAHELLSVCRGLDRQGDLGRLIALASP